MSHNIEKPEQQNKKEKLKEYTTDIIKFEEAREIILLTAKTVSQMKVFAVNNESIKRFSDKLFGKLTVFLDKHRKLELVMRKHSICYGKETLYSDKQTEKSIPFLFFKDGIQVLIFYKDLTKDELLDFLDIVTDQANLPVEESGIAISLWERDFANIRYSISDEFLERKIGTGMEPLEYDTKTSSLATGKIEIDEEDRKALGEAFLAEKIADEKTKNYVESEVERIENGMLPLTYGLDKEEIQKLEEMLERNRNTTAEEELVALIMEMLYLENRTEQFTDTVDSLLQCHNRLLEKENYGLATHLINSVLEFKEILSSQGNSRLPALEVFLHNITSNEYLSNLQEYIKEDQLLTPESLLEYLNVLGSKSLPILSCLYEHEKRPHFKRKVLQVLEELESSDITGV